ncbi:MAG: insulinase family protein [Chitinophagales bacterium]|nr:insulinase family protein [Chitinophagales bacterium]
MKEFYETHYLAQASCLTVVADLDEDKLIDTLSKDWMNLPKRSAHINSLDLTKRMNIHQSYTHKRIAQTHIFVAFHIPYVTHQDYFLVQIIQDLCLSQDFSILHDYFVKENSLCLHTSSFITDNIHENLMIWEFKLQNKISHSDFLEALNKFLLLNFAALVSKKNIIARMPIIQLQFAQSCQYKSYLGQQMGQYGIAGYDDFRVHFLENISKVTQNELLRVANQYFSLPFYNSITYNPS